MLICFSRTSDNILTIHCVTFGAIFPTPVLHSVHNFTFNKKTLVYAVTLPVALIVLSSAEFPPYDILIIT